MNLTVKKHPKELDGYEVLSLVEGDRLRIETNLAAGGGDEVLDYTVPPYNGPLDNKGKVTIRITVEEEHD